MGNNNRTKEKEQRIISSLRNFITENMPEVDVFIFVNPGSGGGIAAQLLGPDHTGSTANPLTYFYAENDGFELGPESVTVRIHRYDMTEGFTGDKPGYKQLKDIASSGRKVLASAAGGDGSVMWMINECIAHDIPFSNVICTVIPYGTGNDFARSIGWKEFNGMKPFKMKKKDGPTAIQKLVKLWLLSDYIIGDLWKLTIVLKDQGELKKIDSSTKTKIAVSKRVFDIMNYFSIGPDARIGLGFDRNRSKGPNRNKMVYMYEGFKKFFSSAPTIPLSQWMESLTDGQGEAIISSTDANLSLPRTQGIVAVNVPSYMSGSNVWKSSYRTAFQSGCRVDKAHLRSLLEKRQVMGDSKLEWLTARHRITYPCEKLTLGIGYFRRVHQGYGPYKITFKDMDDGVVPSVEPLRCYFQVDGEFYQMTRPDSATVLLDRQIGLIARKAINNVESECRISRGSVLDWLFADYQPGGAMAALEGDGEDTTSDPMSYTDPISIPSGG